MTNTGRKFQSLLSWIFLADTHAASSVFSEAALFQSLLSWIFLADKPSWA